MKAGKKIGRSFITLAKIGTILLLIILTVTVVTGSIFVFKPGWIINGTTVGWLAERSDLTGLSIAARVLKVRTSSESWRYKTIHIEAEDFAVAPVEEGGFSAGGKSLTAEAGIDLLGSPVLLRIIGPVTIDDAALSLSATEKEEEEEPAVSWRDALRQLKYIEIKPIKVTNLTVSLQDTEEKISVMRIDADTRFEGPVVTVETKVAARSGDLPFQSLSATAEADTTYFEQTGRKASLQFDLNMRNAKASGQLETRSGGEGRHTFRSRVRLPDELVGGDALVNAAGTLESSGSSSKVDMQLTGFYKARHNVLRQITLDRCSIDAVLLTEKSQEKIEASECVLNVSFRKFLKGKSEIIPAPEALTFDINGLVRTGKNRERMSGRVNAKVRTFVSPLYRLTGEAGVTFSGNPDAPRKIGMKLDSDLGIEIDRFGKVVSYLDRSELAIPAPFNALEGKLSCSLKGSVSTRQGQAVLPVVCSTDLKDSIQTIVTAVDGKATVDLATNKTHIEGDIVLDHVTIAAPEIEVTAKLPKVRSDSRFTTGLDPDGFFQDGEWIDPVKKPPPQRRKDAKPLPLTWEVRVKTGRQPFRIATGLADGDVPLNFNLLVSKDQPLEGFIAAQPFTVTVVKKKIGVEQARIEFQRDGDKPIDALIALEKTNQKINVSVFGTVARPRYQISSDPPLSESDAVAGILYNSTDLNASQQTSVAETRAAMADGAIGLISMFFLASTPVESVGYNPHSGVFSANVRVQEGVSLQVGSNFEGERRVGIVKNLWGKLSFEAFALSGAGEDDGRGVAMFRWSNRY